MSENIIGQEYNQLLNNIKICGALLRYKVTLQMFL